MTRKAKRILFGVVAALILAAAISYTGLTTTLSQAAASAVSTIAGSTAVINAKSPDTSTNQTPAASTPAASTAGASTAATSTTAASTATAPSAAPAQATVQNQAAAQLQSKSSSKSSRSLRDIINSLGLSGKVQIRLYVDKSDKLLTVYNGNTPLKSYHVEMGDTGTGDKQVAGDHKTPEGTFYITEKMVLAPADQYLGTRWMRLSYPNIEDAQRGLDSGLISKATYDAIVDAINNGGTPPQDTALGGGVGVHGGSTKALGANWTWGCVGLSNSDVEDFYPYVRVGTKVTIQK